MTTLIYLALTSRAKRRARLEFLCGIPSEIALRQRDRHIRFCGWRAVSLVAESLRFIGQSTAISDRKLREQIQCAQEEGDARTVSAWSRIDRTRCAKRCPLSDLVDPRKMRCAFRRKCWTNPVFGRNALRLTDGSRLRVELSF